MSYAWEFSGRSTFQQLETVRLKKEVNRSDKTIYFTTYVTKIPGDIVSAYSLINPHGEKADVILIDIVSPVWEIEAWRYKGRLRGFKIFLTIINQ